jgi:hypothetical protein
MDVSADMSAPVSFEVEDGVRNWKSDRNCHQRGFVDDNGGIIGMMLGENYD